MSVEEDAGVERGVGQGTLSLSADNKLVISEPGGGDGGVNECVPAGE